MRKWPNLRVNRYKLPDPNTGIVYQHDCDGVYVIACEGVRLTVIASEGLGWDHVSVSTRARCPTWDEMQFVRRLFFRDDETVMQLSVPKNDHINNHQFCLHWWKPNDGREIPRPESFLVGVKTA